MFRRTRKKLVYILIFLIPTFVLLSRFRIFSPIKFGFISIISAPARVLSFPIKEIKKILYYHRTFDEYRRLRTETDVLKARLIGLEEVIRENTRLEKLLEFKRELVYSSVTASVIGRDPSNWRSSMIIDKGKKEGIELGMTVVNALGVVGRIAEVGDNFSKVILLLDPQFSVAAVIKRSGESGLVTGTLQGGCRMSYIASEADVLPGDMVITSKLSSSFPEGLLIGEVVRLNKDFDGSSSECIIEPAVYFSQIEEVLVILQ